jgi:hypothetical protein
MGSTVFYDNAAELATLTNTFSVGGVVTDPTTVALTITTPSGVATSYTFAGGTITKTGPGIYTKDLPCSEVGIWLYLWVGTGAASDAVAGTWTVSSSNLQRLYCTPAELKSRVGIDDSLDDAEILAACESVSRWIDGHCDRVFFRRTETRTYQPCHLYYLDVDDLVSVTTLKTDPDGSGTFATTWTASDYQLLPVNPNTGADQQPYTSIKALGLSFPVVTTGRTDRIQIVGVWGWPAIPSPVKQAAAIMAGDFLKLGGMTFGVAGYGDYGAVRARMSSPALSLLGPYRRYAYLAA